MRSWLRRPRGAFLVAAAVFATAGAVTVPRVTGGGGGSPTTANLWIDTTGGTCVRQAGGGAYSDAGACSSIQTAVAACNGTAGDTIRMKAGTYGSQTITTSRTSPGCTVIAENGTTTGSITPQGNWLEIRNVTINGSLGWADVGTGGVPNHLTFRNVNTSGAKNFWDGGDSIQWIGGDVGPYAEDQSNGVLDIQGLPPSGTNNLTNVLIKNVNFHDITRTARCAGDSVNCHVEVIRIDDGTSNVTLDGVTLDNNDPNSSAILFGSKTNSNKTHDNTLQNSYFGNNGNGPNGVNFGGAPNNLCTGLHVYNNTYSSSSSIMPVANCSDTSSLQIQGNLANKPTSCGTSSVYARNAFVGGTCAASDVSIASSGVLSDGYHLGASSAAIDASGAGPCAVSTDIDGDARPQRSACDAGADELP